MGWSRRCIRVERMWVRSFRGFGSLAPEYCVWPPMWSYQIRHFADSAALKHLSHIKYPLGLHELLFPSSLGIIFIVCLNIFGINDLQSSKITEWPTRQGGQLADPVQYMIFCSLDLLKWFTISSILPPLLFTYKKSARISWHVRQIKFCPPFSRPGTSYFVTVTL